MERTLIELLDVPIAASSPAQRRRLAARALSVALAERLGLAPESMPIERSAQGKPRLAAGITPELRFNLAHSRERALIAISEQLEVGVDLEAIDPDRPCERLARRWFAEVERERVLSGGSAAERRRAFYRIWVAKEACVKATGEGLSALASVTIDERDVAHWQQPRFGERTWKVMQLELGPGWAGAVAAPGFDWAVAMLPAPRV